MSRKSFRIICASVVTSLVVGGGASVALAQGPSSNPAISIPDAPKTTAKAAPVAQQRTNPDHERKVEAQRIAIMNDIPAQKPNGTTTVPGQRPAGKPGQRHPYMYGTPLRLSDHATFTPLWWGMQFTLDPVAAANLLRALEAGRSAKDIVDTIAPYLGPVGPAVLAVMATIVGIIDVIIDQVKKNTTQYGLVINTLWIPVIAWPAKAMEPINTRPGSAARAATTARAAHTATTARAAHTATTARAARA